MAKWQGFRERKNVMGFSYEFLEPRFHTIEKKALLAHIFISCYLLMPLRTFCGLGDKKREKEKQEGSTPFSLSLKSSLSCSVRWNQVVSPGASVCTESSLIVIILPWAKIKRDQRKNTKLTTSSVVPGILVCFLILLLILISWVLKVLCPALTDPGV